MLRVYDEGIEYTRNTDTDEPTLRQHPEDSNNRSIDEEESTHTKPPRYEGRAKPERVQQHAVTQKLGMTAPSRMIPILSQITSSFAIMNPMAILSSSSEEEKERIKAMSMCIERYTCPCPQLTKEDAVTTWIERIHEFSEGPMMVSMNRDIFGKEYSKMRKASLHAVSTARGLIDQVYRFGDTPPGTLKSPAKTSLYLYHMVICFTAIRHVENMEQAGALADGEEITHEDTDTKREDMRRKYINDVLGDASFHKMIATVCLEICAFMHRDINQEDGRFKGGFPVLTNMVGHGGYMMEILVALDWFIKAFYVNLSTSAKLEDVSSTWLGQFSPTLAREMVMPRLVHGYVHILRERIIEQGMFEGERSWLVQTIETDHPNRAIVQEYCTRHLRVLLKTRVSLLVQNAVATTLFSSSIEETTGDKRRERAEFISALIESVLEGLYISLEKGDDVWRHGHITRIIVCSIYCITKMIECPIRLVQLESLCFSCFPLHREEADVVRDWYDGTFLTSCYIAREASQYSSTVSHLIHMYKALSSSADR